MGKPSSAGSVRLQYPRLSPRLSDEMEMVKLEQQGISLLRVQTHCQTTWHALVPSSFRRSQSMCVSSEFVQRILKYSSLLIATYDESLNAVFDSIDRQLLTFRETALRKNIKYPH